MWTGLLVTVVVSAGAFALNEREWSTAVIESAANWTIAANTAGHDGYWSLYTQDSIHLNDEMPFMNHEEYREHMMIKERYFPFWIYLGFVELLYTDNVMAVARLSGVARTKAGVHINSKVVRLYKIEDGQVREWMAICNRDQ